MHAELLNRQHAQEHRVGTLIAVGKRNKDLRSLIKRQIHEVEQDMASALKQNRAWYKTVKHIISIPGVGFVTAVWLTTITLNFTACKSPKQLAAFVGLVPHRKQSGTSLNTHSSVGLVGQDEIRQHLYTATMSALRYNNRIRHFYDGVKQRRGSHKLACVAATHKLLHIIWAVATKAEHFDPDAGVRNDL
jgi:transposase